ncbi:hypothetical protein B566_EDAN003120 [Ephemera danica]|nr:hypothetical protein B566_EDAN003120 [Ephemera danica]
MSLVSDEELDLKELEAQILKFVDKSDVEEMLRIQLSELEMLQSMFSNPGEFCMDDYGALADIHEYIEGRCTVLPPQLDFTIKLILEAVKMEVCVNLPHDYPATEPDIFVRSDKLSRDQQHSLNKDLASFILSLDRGEICICSAVSWLQENALQYVKVPDTPPLFKQESDEQDNSALMFVRYWIYSHHIYSKTKRREILDLAVEYNITGFCLPGRPGIICAEGTNRNCGEWWHRVKCMNWKRIMCKKKETIPVTTEEEISSLRKFGPLKEISFESGKTKSRDCHMDMGELYRYLQEHQCAAVFKEYFGVNGRSSSNGTHAH